VLPLPVLEQAQSDLLNYQGSGSSVMEMSHRGKEFTHIINKAEADLRQLLSIPDNYEVPFSDLLSCMSEAWRRLECCRHMPIWLQPIGMDRAGGDQT